MKSSLQILGALLLISKIVFWSFLSFIRDILSPILNCHARAMAAKKAGKARVSLLPWGSASPKVETSLNSGRLFKQ